MNVYLNLKKLKDELGVADTKADAQLMRLLNRAARAFDNYCGRHFYMKTESMTARTVAGYRHSLPDLYSSSSVTLDAVALVANTDYELEPLSGYPKERMRMLNRSFSIRQKLVIAGIWGYEETKDDSGDTVQDDPLAAGAVAINVTFGGNFAIGETLKIGDEQLYITDINVNALTVKRGVNGTDDVEHVNDTAIYIYTYPDPVEGACLIQVVRWYRGRDAAWGDEAGIDVKTRYAYEPHPSVRVLLNPYRRIVGGGF